MIIYLVTYTEVIRRMVRVPANSKEEAAKKYRSGFEVDQKVLEAEVLDVTEA